MRRQVRTLRIARTLLLATTVWIGLAPASCGNGDDDKKEPPPPPPTGTRTLFDASDPCNAKVPVPTDLFRDDEGVSELGSCNPPTDPIEAAVFAALLDEGVPIDARVVIPVAGSLDGTTLTSTNTFSMIRGTGTSTNAGLPPTLLLKLVGSATRAADWSVVDHTATFDSGAEVIRLSPKTILEFGAYYVAITTDVIQDEDREMLAPAEAVSLLVGTTAIAAGAIDGLEAGTAAKLERERLRLKAVVTLLEGAAAPAIPRGRITSIQGFSTQSGFKRSEQVFADYHANQPSRYPFEADTVGGDIPPADIYSGLPPVVYENILAFRRGTIAAPKLLGDDGRMRDNWQRVVEKVDVHFLVSIPQNVTEYPVILFIPGFGRGSIDSRALANEFAGGPQAAVMAIDLRCHGARSPDLNGVCGENRTQQEIDALVDNEPNNGNPELVGADHIPDSSGAGFFPGDAQALRDSQIAAAVEIVHVLEAIRNKSALEPEGINPSGAVHVVAQGHAVPAVLLALSFANFTPQTVQVPSGGVGYTSLILDGPADLKDAFIGSLPAGIGADRAADYLARLEATVLPSISSDKTGAIVSEKYSFAGTVRRLLLNHGSAIQYIPSAARQTLINTLSLPNNRVSEHNGVCDDFFIFTCQLGDNPAWAATARQQIVAFMDSGGVTVIAPAQ